MPSLVVCGTLSVIFLLGCNASPMEAHLHQTNTSSLSIREPPLVTSTTVDAFTKRRLRFYGVDKAVENDKNEERVGTTGFSMFLEKMSFKILLKTKTNPKDLFEKLHLADAGVKLDDNLIFVRWLQYVHQYRKKEWFNDGQILELLRQSRSEDEIVALFHNLRQAPKMENFADNMQRIILKDSPSTQKVMNQVWLNNKATPNEVFKILYLEVTTLDVNNVMFLNWLRYTELYREKMGVNSFSELQTMDYLLDVTRIGIEEQFGTVLPELKKLAENMQTFLFDKSIHVKIINPKAFGDLLLNPYDSWISITAQPKSDNFQTLKAYTLRYAEDLGGNDVLEKVKTLFTNNDPVAAITAAMKASL